MINKYKGFDKNLMKDDLNKEELECYEKLMEGIHNASQKEKDEVAHLMGVFIDNDETIRVRCVRCGKDFEDNYENVTEDNKRTYCDECLSKMWG